MSVDAGLDIKTEMHKDGAVDVMAGMSCMSGPGACI
jgi:hypothetical protein